MTRTWLWDCFIVYIFRLINNCFESHQLCRIVTCDFLLDFPAYRNDNILLLLRMSQQEKKKNNQWEFAKIRNERNSIKLYKRKQQQKKSERFICKKKLCVRVCVWINLNKNAMKKDTKKPVTKNKSMIHSDRWFQIKLLKRQWGVRIN